jgi:CDP-paratose 2-epimerase
MQGQAKTAPVLITGGAGFIGTNVAKNYLEQGRGVHILDNLSRSGVEGNVLELQRAYPDKVRWTHGDVRDRILVREAVANASTVYHLAAQVAVTSSLEDPRADMETNLVGTLNVLEAVREHNPECPVLFTSTNKVYGRLANVRICERGGRHEPEDERLSQHGIPESHPLEFLSPYGCSKGAADQYVLDYAHSYGLRACVFRMSCIYGTHQLGSEDQGWVAHFLRQALKGEPITIFGDGRQVRDLLFVDDLVRAMRLALDRMETAAGKAFNMGGGVGNSTSLLALLEEIGALTHTKLEVEWGPERLADQRWFVADTTRATEILGWSPKISIREGLRRLHGWYMDRPALVEQRAVQVA